MKNIRLALFGALVILSGTSSLWAQSSTPRLQMVSRPMEVHPLPPEMAQRFDSLRNSLQLSAKSWVEQQARLESQRAATDLAALRSQIRSRFASSLASSNSGSGQVSGISGVPAGADIEAMVFIVLMQASNDANQDLQQIMDGIKAANAAKQQLRDIQDQLNRDVASANGKMAQQPCRTPACAALPGELKQLAAATAQTNQPIRLAVPANATYGQIQQVAAQMNHELASVSDISQQQQLQIQMLMDRMSQLEEMMSNLMKTQQDTASNIVGNLK
jgi:hypothetical protein